MKKIMLLLIMLFLLNGQVPKNDELRLKVSRIQSGRNQEIDYLKYIDCKEKDKVEFNSIDTSHFGTYQVVYKYHSFQKKLTVDIVEMYNNNIINPETLLCDIVKNPQDITVLVNKVHGIPQDYQPDDLVNVIDSQQQLRKEAAEAYKQFYLEAKKRNIAIYTISGYRTNELQTTYWNNQVKVKGKEYASLYSAYPGRSEHQLGLAIDISYKTTGDRLSESVKQSDIGKFIVSDGYRYGFILRYPKDKEQITNYGYEPWHMRYVGKKLAKILHDQNLTLEEYYHEAIS